MLLAPALRGSTCGELGEPVTVILTFVHRLYVIQASDRLVSMVDERTGIVPVDPTANKCVIYRARDGVLTIGFAGLARIRGMPADDWIVETLTGEPQRFPAGERMGMRMGGDLHLLTAPQAVRRLAEAMGRDIPRSCPQPFELTIAGLRQRRGRVIPYWVGINKPAKQSPSIIHRSPRYPDPRGRVLTLHNGNINDNDAREFHVRLSSLVKSIGEAHRRQPSVEEVASAMVDHIRELAGKRSGIDANVLVSALTVQGGYSRFHNVQKFPLAAMRGDTPVMIAPDSAQTPWIVAKGMQNASSFAVGDADYDLGGYPLKVFGGKPEGRILGMHTSIRPPSMAELQRRYTVGVQQRRTSAS